MRVTFAACGPLGPWTISNSTVSLAYDCRVVDKYIWTAIAPDEAVTFLVIEPLDYAFHYSTTHCNSLQGEVLMGIEALCISCWRTLRKRLVDVNRHTAYRLYVYRLYAYRLYRLGVHQTTCGFPETVLRV